MDQQKPTSWVFIYRCDDGAMDDRFLTLDGEGDEKNRPAIQAQADHIFSPITTASLSFTSLERFEDSIEYRRYLVGWNRRNLNLGD